MVYDITDGDEPQKWQVISEICKARMADMTAPAFYSILLYFYVYMWGLFLFGVGSDGCDSVPCVQYRQRPKEDFASPRYKQAILWVLGTELGSSTRSANSLNSWAISLFYFEIGSHIIPAGLKTHYAANSLSPCPHLSSPGITAMLHCICFNHQVLLRMATEEPGNCVLVIAQQS